MYHGHDLPSLTTLKDETFALWFLNLHRGPESLFLGDGMKHAKYLVSSWRASLIDSRQ